MSDKKSLTDRAIKTAKPAEAAYRLYDTGGLYVEIASSGGKWFRLKYRHQGKEKRLSLGTYPDTGLADARARRDEARKLIAAGIDPSAHRKAAKAAGVERATNSFEVIAREWLAKQSFVPKYAEKVAAWFRNDVFPYVGHRPVAELTPKEFLTVLQRVEKRAVESAHRIKQNCSQVMRYAIATGRADRDPTADLKGALARPAENHHGAITEPKEFGGLLRTIDGFTGTFVVKTALQLAPLVFVRPGELCAAEWSEFDLEAAEWNIPAARMKRDQPLLVPLSRQALALLHQLLPLTGRGRYVFPSTRTPHANASQRPMTTAALLAALQRLGYTGEQMTTHGFRASARTMLDEQLGIRPDFIEHQLAHAVRDPNGRAYNRTAHLDDRRKMMQTWADYLDSLKGESNVVPFVRRA
jgi:integrase